MITLDSQEEICDDIDDLEVEEICDDVKIPVHIKGEEVKNNNESLVLYLFCNLQIKRKPWKTHTEYIW